MNYCGQVEEIKRLDALLLKNRETPETVLEAIIKNVYATLKRK